MGNSKPKLIECRDRIIEELRRNQEVTSADKSVAGSVSYDFNSDIVPPFEQGEFKIANYEVSWKQHEVIYSEILISNGLTWRLKVYPNGNGNAKDQYLSVFLEMMRGIQGETNKYEYKIDMLHPVEKDQIVSREYSSDFEIGECWGYNRFYRIDGIQEEGFVGKDGSLQLRFFVRASSYAQHSWD